MQKRERKHIESEIQILIIIYTNRLNHDISNRKIRFKARRKIPVQRSMNIDQSIPRFLRIFTKNRFFFFETIHEETTQHRFVILFKRRRKKKNIVILYRIDAFQFSSLAPISERKVDETEKRERRQRSRGERRGEKPFSNRSDYFQIANTGEEGGGESISAGSESRQTTDRTSNPISHHTTSCIWSTGGGGDVTWQYGETHTRLKASISRTKQIPRQIGRFSLRTAGLPTFSIRPHSVRGIR